MKETEFISLMTELRGCYAMNVSDPKLWALNVKKYGKELNSGKFQDTVLRYAFDTAWQYHKEFFPSLGQFVDLCKITEKNLGVRDAKALPPPRHDDSVPTDPKVRACIDFVLHGKKPEDPELAEKIMPTGSEGE